MGNFTINNQLAALEIIKEAEEGGAGGGVIIDDNDPNSTTKTYSAKKTQDEINLKANIADVYAKSDLYTRIEIDTTVNNINTQLTTKANIADVYNKTEVDTSLALKANSVDVYTKTEVDTSLTLKADQTYVDSQLTTINGAITLLISDKASIGYVDTQLATKANIADVYTKTEIDNKAPKIFVIIDPTTADIVIPSASFLDYPIPNTAENGYFSIASNIITFSRAGRYIIEGDMKYVRSANVTGQYIYTTLRNGANGYPLTYSTNFRYLGSGSSSPESPDRTSFVLDIAVNATIKFSLNASAGGNTTSVYRGLPNTIIAGSVPSPRALFRITYLGN